MSIHEATVYLVTCDGCGERLDEFAVRSGSTLLIDLEGFGWTSEEDEHFCEWCSDRRSCARTGHEIRRGATSCRCGSESRAVVMTAGDPTLRMESHG